MATNVASDCLIFAWGLSYGLSNSKKRGKIITKLWKVISKSLRENWKIWGNVFRSALLLSFCKPRFCLSQLIKVKLDGEKCLFSTFLRLQGDHRFAYAQTWRHFLYFSKSFQTNINEDSQPYLSRKFDQMLPARVFFFSLFPDPKFISTFSKEGKKRKRSGTCWLSCRKKGWSTCSLRFFSDPVLNLKVNEVFRTKNTSRNVQKEEVHCQSTWKLKVLLPQAKEVRV